MEVSSRSGAGDREEQKSIIESLEARIAPASFVVTTLLDSGPGSLRAQIDAANLSEGPDEITFAKRGAIKLTSDLPEITDTVTISGPGASKLAIKGQQNQIFAIGGEGESLIVEISGMKLSGGEAADGGAVHVRNPEAALSLSKTVITKNRAIGSVLTDPETGAYVIQPGRGGGVFVESGTVTIESSKITGNKAGLLETVYFYKNGKYVTETVFTANGDGGGIAVASEANLTVISTIVSGNTAGTGGGIHNAGQTTVEERSKITKNVAQGVYGGESRGGGIFNDAGGIITIEESKLTGNRAIGGTGTAGYYNGAAGTGGAALGGGIFNAEDGIVSVIASKISGNTAIGGKGGTGATGDTGAYAGYYSRRGGKGGTGGEGGVGGDAAGGGIANQGTLTIESSKVSGNSAVGGEGGKGGKGGTGGRGAEAQAPYKGYYGRIPGKPPGPGGPGGNGGPGGPGGIGVDGGVHSPESVPTVISSTISGNSERDGATGKKGAVGKTGPRGYSGGKPYYR